MKITNKLGLPEVLVRALQRDPYSRGAARYSVTQLIDAPQPRVLKELYANEIERDISDAIWLLLGKGVHHVLETGAAREGDADHVIEERVFVTVNGVTVSGAMDVQRKVEGHAILDWKVTSTYTVDSADRHKKWEEQLNLYRIMRLMATGEDTSSLTIVMFLRDWSKSRAKQSADYPQAPIQVLGLPVWTNAKAMGFLEERINAHVAADTYADIDIDSLSCTDEERWKRAGTFEVVQITKDGREWVRHTFDGEGAKEEAEKQMAANIAAMKNPAKTWVRERPAVPTRCMEWCEAAPFCSQWNREKNS